MAGRLQPEVVSAPVAQLGRVGNKHRGEDKSMGQLDLEGHPPLPLQS